MGQVQGPLRWFRVPGQIQGLEVQVGSIEVQPPETYFNHFVLATSFRLRALNLSSWGGYEQGFFDHLKKIGERVDSLEKKSEKMKKWRKRQRSSEKRSKEKVTPIRLDFGSDEEGPEKEKTKKTFSDVETDQSNPDWNSEAELKDKEDPEPSITRSITVFDRMGKKLTNKDLRLKLLEAKQKGPKKVQSEKSLSKGSRSHRDKSHSKPEDEHRSDLSYKSDDNSDGSSNDGDDTDDTSESAEGDGKYKEEDLRKVLKKIMAEKGPQSGLTVGSPFTKKVRDSPLPRSYRGVGDLKFNGTMDPVEFLSRFNTEMEVYQIKDRTKCCLLVATLRDSAHQWFKRLPSNSIKSWRQMGEMFVTQFRASVTFAPPANTLANIKQRDNETLNEYFKRFNAEVPRVRKTTDETYKNFLIAGVKPGTEFWKELQSREPTTLADFYAKAERHKVVEQSLENLKKDNASRDWNRNKKNMSYSPKDRSYNKRTTYNTTSADGQDSGKEVRTAPLSVNTTSSKRTVEYKYPSSKGSMRYSEYTPLAAPVEHIFEVGDKSGMFKKPTRSGPPGIKDLTRYCAFHDANGHETADCRHLKDHIEDLIRKGFLTKFVVQEAKKYKDDKSKRDEEKSAPERTTRAGSIHTIIGGPYIGGFSRNAMKNYTREARGNPLTNIYHLADRPPKLFRGEAADITFTEDDARHVHHPHNDALVVTITIGGLNVHRVLVDNGSSCNILAYDTYQKMGLADKEMSPAYNDLYGFTGGPVQVVGCQVDSRECYSKALRTAEQASKHLLLVDGGTTDDCYKYLEAPMKNEPTRHVKESCNMIMIIQHPGEESSTDIVFSSGVDTQNKVNDSDFEDAQAESSPKVSSQSRRMDTKVQVKIDLDPRMPESRETTGAAGDTLSIQVDATDSSKELKIGKQLEPETREALTHFLKSNLDVFAWCHSDMVGIDPRVMSHHLNIDPERVAVRQKRRAISGERALALKEEVDRLLEARLVRESFYPDWLANPVLVKKPNGKWRTCVDFTDLNKACPKDSFPLPRIDQLVDATTGHALLSFMDAYSGYNQIPMYEPDQEHTSFITDRGLYCYIGMPFGLLNAGATYQRLVNRMFKDQIGKTMEVYVDDMLVKSKATGDHVLHLSEMFNILRRFRMKLNPQKCVFGVESGKFLGFIVNHRGIEANPAKIKALVEMRSPHNIKEVQSLTGRIAALNRFVSKSSDKCREFFAAIKKGKNFEWSPECEAAFTKIKEQLGSPPLLSKPLDGEVLILYLAVSEYSISAVLVREEAQVQHPVYYVSKRLLDVETRYSNMEKLAYSLILALRKLRPYFQAHQIEVRTSFPLRQVLHKPEASGRLMKWAVELGQFDIEYKPRTAIKGQVLADFLLEFPPSFEVKGDECIAEPTAPEEIAENCSPWWTLYVDGAVNGNGAGAGIVLISPEGHKLQSSIHFAFYATNNDAEYEALIAGLKLALEMKVENLTVFSDSMLVVWHIRGGFQARGPRTDLYMREATMLGVIPLEIQLQPSIPKLEVMNLEPATELLWTTPIMNYITKGIVPERMEEARRIKYQAASASQKDTHRFTQACDRCQRFANFNCNPAVPLKPLTSPWPFAVWGIDLIGELPKGKEGVKYVVVAVDYFTKWAEAEPLATITTAKIKKFVFREIVCRFGVPYKLISDNGKQFDSKELRKLCEDLGIQKGFTAVYHPQSNGQTEAVNKIIKHTLKSKLEESKGSMVPVEIGAGSFRRDNYDPENNEVNHRLYLDLVEEVRTTAQLKLAAYQQRTRKYFDSKVRARPLKVGDLVLRRMMPNMKVPGHGVFGANWEGPYLIKAVLWEGTYHLTNLDGKIIPRAWNGEHLKKYYQ
ncbi:hypothetical protein POM88_009548 [Heracleum sosnowskyi]|uniref:Uncharacterized protein n=1 Tax=Heracleum sosnowskyi TaxID=360622 RepID=A0AAD8JBZ6_9APIA|nr:hypothetical protein POM88_009548 [Heracleum sosnowskyi]